MVRAVWLLQTLKGLIPSYSFSYPLSTSTPNQISNEMIHPLELWFALCFFLPEICFIFSLFMMAYAF